jgi:hypothetical protein
MANSYVNPFQLQGRGGEDGYQALSKGVMDAEKTVHKIRRNTIKPLLVTSMYGYS